MKISDGSNPVDDNGFFIWNRSSVRALQVGSADACNPRYNSARIRLSVGDPSSSQSECYKIIIDDVVAHESPFLERSIREIIQYRLDSIQCGSNMWRQREHRPTMIILQQVLP